MNTTKALTELGLTQNEIKLYKYLLRKGESLGGQIYKDNSLDKSSSYRALNQLESKGLVYTIGESRNKMFGARGTGALKNLHKNKVEEVISLSPVIDNFIKELDEYARDNYKKTNVQVFEGQDGYKIFSRKRLDTSNVLIRQLGPLKERIKYLPDFYDFVEEIIEERVKKNISIKVMFDYTVKTDHLDRTKPEILKEARQVMHDIQLKHTVTTYGNRTGFHSELDGRFLGILIEDRMITGVLNSLFDTIWRDAKVVY